MFGKRQAVEDVALLNQLELDVGRTRDRRVPEVHLVVVLLALGLAATTSDGCVEVGRDQKRQLGDLRPITHHGPDALGHAVKKGIDVVYVLGLPPPLCGVGKGRVPLNTAVRVARADSSCALRSVRLEQLVTELLEPASGRAPPRANCVEARVQPVRRHLDAPSESCVAWRPACHTPR